MMTNELIEFPNSFKYEFTLGHVRQQVAKLHSHEVAPFFHSLFRAVEDAGMLAELDDLDNFLLDLGIQERVATDVRYLMLKYACDVISDRPVNFTEPQLAVLRTALVQTLRAIEK